MRYEITVTWLPSVHAKNPRGPGTRVAPSFTVDAVNEESARGQVQAILDYPMDAYVEVKPTQQVKISLSGLAVIMGLCEETALVTREELDDLVSERVGSSNRKKDIRDREKLLDTLQNLNDVLNLTTTLHATVRTEPKGAKKRKTA